MRYPKTQKDATRQRIVEKASRLFRKRGVESTGVKDLMESAGLTHGGFYAHFKDKDELVRAAVEFALGESEARMENAVNIGAFIDLYLGEGHMEHPEVGCPIAAMGPEIARGPRRKRKGLSAGLEDYTTRIAARLPSKAPEDAVALLSLLVGNLLLARCMDTADASRQVMESGRLAAKRLCGIAEDGASRDVARPLPRFSA